MVRSLRREEYDPRPIGRQQDLAARRTEYDSDTARINERTRAMNRDARVQYQQDMAAYRQRTKKKPDEPRSLMARVSSGLRRMMA